VISTDAGQDAAFGSLTLVAGEITLVAQPTETLNEAADATLGLVAGTFEIP
jgi:hypothetical protein